MSARSFDMTWRMTLEDFKVLTTSYARLSKAQRMRRLFSQALAPLVLVAGLVFLWFGDAFKGWVCIAYAALVAVLRLILAPWLIRRRFENQKLDRGDTNIHADEDGLQVDTPTISAHIKWDGIHRVDCLEHHTLIWQNPYLGFSIPERAFATPEDAKTFAAFAMEMTDGQEP